jgi:nitroreductase
LIEKVIQSRRALRAISPVNISEEEIKKIAELTSLAPSCFNNQPWRYVFVQDPVILQNLSTSLTKGNAWAKRSSLIIGVFSSPEFDCQIKERKFYFFDTGMATAFLILLLTSKGFVAHPIAGFDPILAKKVMNIPENMELLTLVIVGKHDPNKVGLLSEKQRLGEENRPKRKPVENFVFFNSYED